MQMVYIDMKGQKRRDGDVNKDTSMFLDTRTDKYTELGEEPNKEIPMKLSTSLFPPTCSHFLFSPN